MYIDIVQENRLFLRIWWAKKTRPLCQLLTSEILLMQVCTIFAEINVVSFLTRKRNLIY